MFKYDLSYTNLIHLAKVSANEKKLKITYYWDGRIETQTFADQSEFDTAVDSITSAGLLLIGETYYNKDRLSMVIPNGKNVTFMFIGNVNITHVYEDVSDVDAVIAEIEPEFIEINGKWYQGKQIHVAKTNDATFTISYDYLGMDWFDVTYEDQAAYDAAVEKLANLGNGDTPTPPTPKTAKPTFSPSAGSVPVGTSVTISCADTGATIYYTTDGTTPSESSSVYSSAIAIPNEGITIKAVAKAADKDLSSVASASYTVVLPKVATPTFTPAAGEVTSGTEVTIATTTDGATIYYTTDGSVPTSDSTEYTAPIAVTAAVTIKAIAVKADMTDSSVGSASYTIGIPTAAAPTFTPPAGEVAKGTTIALASTTPGAVIHYTVDNSTPTASSPVYSDPIAINAATTIKAITIADGYKNSSVASAAYTVPATIEYYYAGVYNNPTEEEEDDHMADPITQEVLENLTNVDKGVATKKEYAAAGAEHKFDGIDEDKGGRIVYAYPKHFGALTSYITNGITGPIETSFEVATIMCGDVEYYVYYLRNATFNPYGNYAFV